MKTRFAIALTLLVACAPVASAKKKSVNVSGRESSGFNALEHVLQKPLGNPAFPEGEKGFGRHIYFGLNGGGSLISNDVLENVNPGYKFGAHIGGWFTPVHGIRISGNFGKHSKNNGGYDVLATSFKADYMMNFSSLLRGYNPGRTFELIGGTGLRYMYMRQGDAVGGNFGLSASLQMRFNLTNSFYVYAEPEVTLLAGPAASRLYSDLAINVGLGYRIASRKERLAGATKFVQSAEDNIFYGLSAGLFTFTAPGTKFNSPAASIFMGKMFSSTSGLQLSARLGHFHKYSMDSKNNFGLASLDYVLNLNNLASGYRPDKPFQLLFNVGPSIVKHQDMGDKIYFGVHAGLTGLVNVSPNWGIFVSPQIYGFSNTFTEKIGMGKRPMLALDLGVRYTVGDFSRRFKDNCRFTPSDSVNRVFFNFGVGGGERWRIGTHPFLNAYIGIGKRFTPISSWRFNIDGEYFRNYGRIVANIDYLSSMTTAMMGYNENRLFDLQTVAGVFAGASKFKDCSVKATFGVKAGMQANFRITRNWSVYLEPAFLATYGTSQYDDTYWSPEGRVNIGVKYSW